MSEPTPEPREPTFEPTPEPAPEPREPTRVPVRNRYGEWKIPPRGRRLPGPPYVPVGIPDRDMIEAWEAEADAGRQP